MKDYIYLAGPMEQLDKEAMTGWRNYATSKLEPDFKTLDPCRRVEFHDQLNQVLGSERRTRNISHRIFKQDMQDIAHSRVVLADVRRDSGRGTGTAMELMYAHIEHKIIILYANKGDFPHPFLYSIATEVYYDLDDAIEAVKEYY